MALLNARNVKFLSRSVNFLVSQTDRVRSIDIRSFSDQESDDGGNSTKRKSSSRGAFSFNCSRDGDISSSMTLLQDGLHISELPVLVRRTIDVSALVELPDGDPAVGKTVEVDHHASRNKQNEELNKVVQLHLREVSTVSEVLQYLLVIPSKDVTPLVALSILERIIELRNDAADEGPSTKPPPTESNAIAMLCSVICRSSNSRLILQGLKTVIMVRLHFPREEKKKYLDIFIKECLERVHSGELGLMHICWLVENLFHAGARYQIISDSIWSEIVARETEVTLSNVNRVFALLLYLKSSRQVVLRMLESRVSDLYSHLSQKQIIHMLHIMCLLKIHSRNLLEVICCWTRLNIHKVTETGLRDIVMLMNSIQYTSPILETAIERFTKARGTLCKDMLLMTALAEKVRLFQWRSPVILESISSFFVQNVQDISSDTLGGLVQVFGQLNYEPTNAVNYFQLLEKVLLTRFADLDPDTVVAILLSFVYIQRYPLNIMKRLFSPGFLDRLNFQWGQDEARRQYTYNNLKLLDTALHLECPTYKGPYLPRNLTAKTLLRDSRLLRLQNKMCNPLNKLLGGHKLYQLSVVLPKLPLNHLYIVDFMIHLDKDGKPQSYQLDSGVHKKVALILLLPEHFCKPNKDILIGPQAMRMRHLNLIGLSVIPLVVLDLERLGPKELLHHMENKLKPSILLQE